MSAVADRAPGTSAAPASRQEEETRPWARVLAGGDLSPVAGHPWLGTLLFYPANESHLEETRSLLAELNHFAGATLTDGLLSVRFLSHDNLICQRVMRDIWQHLRPHLTAKAPHSPRIWQT